MPAHEPDGATTGSSPLEGSTPNPPSTTATETAPPSDPRDAEILDSFDGDLDAWEAVDGEWTVEGRAVKQTKVARGAEGGTTTMLCKAETDERESVILEVVAEVDQVTPDSAIDRATWGFGLEAMFRNRSVVLRSAQGPEGTSVFEFPDLTAIPFEHGREGTYRLRVTHPKYVTETRMVQVTAGHTSEVRIKLGPRTVRAAHAPTQATTATRAGDERPDGWKRIFKR